jgi:hypothetical protein
MFLLLWKLLILLRFYHKPLQNICCYLGIFLKRLTEKNNNFFSQHVKLISKLLMATGLSSRNALQNKWSRIQSSASESEVNISAISSLLNVLEVTSGLRKAALRILKQVIGAIFDTYMLLTLKCFHSGENIFNKNSSAPRNTKKIRSPKRIYRKYWLKKV